MASKITIDQIKKNVVISVFAQIISFVISFVMNLILPKFIDEFQYAYWQTYLLYVGYVGILHFGLLDGIVLRYAQYNYDELDKSRIRSQFYILAIISFFFSCLGVLGAYFWCDSNIKWIIIFTSIGIITRNIFNFVSYSLQMTNRIDKYAIMTIGYRLFYGALIFIFLIMGLNKFYYVCIIDLCSDIFGVIIGGVASRELLVGKGIAVAEAISEFRKNVSSGIILMAANWSSFLLTGSARLIIQWHWNELTFGLVSFSFSITNLFLTFIAAISVVLFPSLKRMDSEKMYELYGQIKELLDPFLVCIIIFYYPGCWMLEKWLPNYGSSLKFLGILLPIIIPMSKVSLLTNNYLKAFRQEKEMLVINMKSVILALFLFVISAYVFDNMILLLIFMVAVMEIRYVLCEREVMKKIGCYKYKDCIIEIVMMLLFVFSAMQNNKVCGMIIYFWAEMVYVIIYKERISKIILRK